MPPDDEPPDDEPPDDEPPDRRWAAQVRQIGGPDIGVRCTPRRPQKIHSAHVSRHSAKPMSRSSKGWKAMRPLPMNGGEPESGWLPTIIVSE